MYGGQDYGASQFGGAGFIASQQNDGTTGTQANRGSKNAKAQSLRAVTIKQLVDAIQHVSSDEEIRLDDEEISNVTIVGKLISIKPTSTALVLEVNDGTGRVEVKHWSDSEDETHHDWQEGSYVRVHGHIRNFDNQRSIVGFSIRSIEDFDEVTYHFLQCIFQHAHLSRKYGGLPAAGMQAGALPRGGFGGGPAGPGPMDKPAAAGGFTPVQADVLRAIEAAPGPDVHFDQLASQLQQKYNAQQVKQAVEVLMDEGRIYTTNSDLHYALAGG